MPGAAGSGGRPKTDRTRNEMSGAKDLGCYLQEHGLYQLHQHLASQGWLTVMDVLFKTDDKLQVAGLTKEQVDMLKISLGVRDPSREHSLMGCEVEAMQGRWKCLDGTELVVEGNVVTDTTQNLVGELKRNGAEGPLTLAGSRMDYTQSTRERIHWDDGDLWIKQGLMCLKCHNPSQRSWRYCPKCGQELREQDPEIDSQVTSGGRVTMTGKAERPFEAGDPAEAFDGEIWVPCKVTAREPNGNYSIQWNGETHDRYGADPNKMRPAVLGEWRLIDEDEGSQSGVRIVFCMRDSKLRSALDVLRMGLWVHIQDGSKIRKRRCSGQVQVGGLGKVHIREQRKGKLHMIYDLEMQPGGVELAGELVCKESWAQYTAGERRPIRLVRTAARVSDEKETEAKPVSTSAAWPPVGIWACHVEDRKMSIEIDVMKQPCSRTRGDQIYTVAVAENGAIISRAPDSKAPYHSGRRTLTLKMPLYREGRKKSELETVAKQSTDGEHMTLDWDFGDGESEQLEFTRIRAPGAGRCPWAGQWLHISSIETAGDLYFDISPTQVVQWRHKPGFDKLQLEHDSETTLGACFGAQVQWIETFRKQGAGNVTVQYNGLIKEDGMSMSGTCMAYYPANKRPRVEDPLVHWTMTRCSFPAETDNVSLDGRPITGAAAASRVAKKRQREEAAD
eukprot:TRINITY_DN18131_c0_g1_i1.p1 TRINITY_DN18131_c0_g1~~TRINITY_DN18131_c0_g1_i1.p1  ORF type:complete len:675 (+),score=196.21 TRINITY_DN18131_c0_g1_i1:83-2107(+)